MELKKALKAIFFAMAMFWQLACLVQKKMDLAQINFSEDIKELIDNMPDLHQGKLGNRQDMTSYGFDNDGRFTFTGLVPSHIELISWNGKLVSYAFKIRSFADQQKIENFFKVKYKNANLQTSKFINIYQYKDDKITAELRTVIEEKFQDGASGYFDVKSIDFSKAFEEKYPILIQN
ncbi:hypothetical protein PBAL39_19599 [Pedobacter sp. BAL39]|uniref:hypothetical protein n=1 Tax=Pedobacter sp. BAL39 TaxID=391596 RepID=UPI0001559305|nr:hypothetical protein [Pedobacter sp. BAL39]EDM36121.1 hypothetical protein PBAL39_19599 [Pedobacter sp. BAL39]